MKICSKGKMFDLGGGKQFDKVEDLQALQAASFRDR